MGAHKGLASASRIMAWLALVGTALLPIMVIATFLAPTDHGKFILNIAAGHISGLLHADVPLRDQAIALAIQLIPTGFSVWALLSLHRLFAGYAKGQIFSASAVRALGHVATALFIAVIAGFFAEAGASLALTLSNPPGERLVTLSASSRQFAELFWAGVILIIARAMREGLRVADENAGFV